jgi:hypothetical protein
MHRINVDAAEAIPTSRKADYRKVYYCLPLQSCEELGE